MGNKLNLVGERFGLLTVLNEAGRSSRGSVLWDCSCECGGTKTSSTVQLRSKHTTSCGCRKATRYRGWKGFGDLGGTFWRKIVSGAESRGIQVAISIQDAWNLFLEQGKKCALTGLPIFLPETARSYFTASLDRKNSSEGYLPGNIQWVHKDINMMKNMYDQDYFINMCSLVAKNSAGGACEVRI